MSYAIDIPKKKNTVLLAVIGLLLSLLAFGIPMVMKMLDQKDESLHEARSFHDAQIRGLNEQHEKNVKELETDLTSAKEDLRTVKTKMEEYNELNEGAKVRIKELESYVDKFESQGFQKDSVLALARLRGEIRQYEVALNTANSKINLLENSVKSLQSDLLAAEQKIIELKESLASSESQVMQLNEELANQKGIGENGIRNLEQAFIIEKSGDVLPGRKRFFDEKFNCYYNARLLLISIQQMFSNSDLLNGSIARLNSKMEGIRPGSTKYLQSMKSF